jgi:starch synthase (maltosyl-transferring)
LGVPDLESARAVPDEVFLSEAFTKPKMMKALAKAGFTQSYTYFTWRETKAEFEEYFTELTQTEMKDYFRGNLWPNTPDILPVHLQTGGRPAFMMRAVLAATLSSVYGIYSGFELAKTRRCRVAKSTSIPRSTSGKSATGMRRANIKEWITRINQIRQQKPRPASLRQPAFLRGRQREHPLLWQDDASEGQHHLIVVKPGCAPHPPLLHPRSDRRIRRDRWRRYQVHDLLTTRATRGTAAATTSSSTPHTAGPHLPRPPPRGRKPLRVENRRQATERGSQRRLYVSILRRGCGRNAHRISLDSAPTTVGVARAKLGALTSPR